MDRSLYLVSYDISDNQIRAKISKYLLGFTVGRQKSVYECWFTLEELKSLYEWLEAIIFENDKVYIFKLLVADEVRYFGVAERISLNPIVIGKLKLLKI